MGELHDCPRSKSPKAERRHKLLLSTYAVSPTRGSEPGVGWRRARDAAREFDVVILCPEHEYRNEIAPWLRSNDPIENLRFFTIPLTKIEERLHNMPYLTYLACRRWQRRAYLVASSLVLSGEFDLVHHITWNSFREPGYLWRLNVPFIWGPVGGTQNYPFRFLFHAGIEGAIIEGLRSLVNRYQFRFLPRVKQAAKEAALILAANSQGVADFKNWHGIDVECLPDACVDVHHLHSADAKPLEPYDDVPGIRLVWCGLFIHCKALHLLIEGLGRIRHRVKFELSIVGDGPLKRRWKSLARRLGVDSHCRWHGFVPHNEALAIMRRSDALVFSSMRDTSGNVVFEALANGLPVICFDHNGAGDAITPNCGIKIPVTNPSDAIVMLAAAIECIATDPPFLNHLRQGARERAIQLSSHRNNQRMFEYYRMVIATHGNRREVAEEASENHSP